MRSTVCTLFEGSYHHGVAALANSLHHAGFRGDIHAGYRGALPPWAAGAAPLSLPGPWLGASAYDAAPGLRIVFLALGTDHHLTNHKPEFMLALMDGPAAGTEALFYLDPDIVLVRPWRFFEEWVGCGVALCEDLNSPLPENHPRRVGWRRYYGARGMALEFRGREYVNGGFVGVQMAHRQFLADWQRAMNLMAEEIGSLSLALTDNARYKSTGFADCFDRTDQDGLNVAIEACELPVSIIGQEAMALKPGPWLLPHALGAAKPWQRNYLRHALGGEPPRPADKAFWRFARGPISTLPASTLLLKPVEMALAALLGRCYRRA
jgi:hypothetical protein